MLGSSSDGEVLNAVRLIKQLLKAGGLSFSDLAQMLDGQWAVANMAAQDVKEPKRKNDWTEEPPYCYVYDLLLGGFPLNNREQEFLTSLTLRWDNDTPWLSEKQHKWLLDIARKHGIPPIP